MDDLLFRILELFDRLDSHCVYWSVNAENKTIIFYVNCNDLFFWGCSDAEDINEENFPLLEQTWNDYKTIDPNSCFAYSLELWAARVRKMRPQGCCYPKNPALWPLFDAAGPEREINLCNPYKPGEREELKSKVKDGR